MSENLLNSTYKNCFLDIIREVEKEPEPAQKGQLPTEDVPQAPSQIKHELEKLFGVDVYKGFVHFKKQVDDLSKKSVAKPDELFRLYNTYQKTLPWPFLFYNYYIYCDSKIVSLLYIKNNWQSNFFVLSNLDESTFYWLFPIFNVAQRKKRNDPLYFNNETVTICRHNSIFVNNYIEVYLIFLRSIGLQIIDVTNGSLRIVDHPRLWTFFNYLSKQNDIHKSKYLIVAKSLYTFGFHIYAKSFLDFIDQVYKNFIDVLDYKKSEKLFKSENEATKYLSLIKFIDKNKLQVLMKNIKDTAQRYYKDNIKINFSDTQNPFYKDETIFDNIKMFNFTHYRHNVE